jgi:hypothetical protein
MVDALPDTVPVTAPSDDLVDNDRWLRRKCIPVVTATMDGQGGVDYIDSRDGDDRYPAGRATIRSSVRGDDRMAAGMT